MTIPEKVTRQKDFSAGEILAEAKRRDDVDVIRAGARQMKNWRVEAAGNLVERPGRSALLVQAGRTERVRLSSSESVLMSFDYSGGSGRIIVRTTAGVTIGSNTGYPWTDATAGQIVYCVINRDILLTFPGMRPRVVRVPVGLGSVSFSSFSFRTGVNGQSREPFYRFPDSYGITLVPSARTGSITLTASAAWFNASHVGSTIRWVRRQVLITGYTSPTIVTGTVIETLPNTATWQIDAAVVGFEVGQVVEGETTGARGEIVQVTPGSPNQTLTIVVDRPSGYPSTNFNTGENLIGPITTAVLVSGTASVSPVATVQWDESLMSDYRGWPQSCVYDRTRLEFCDFPQIPEGVAWSSIGLFDDFYVDSSSDSAIFELVPGKARVYHVTGGADQFVFTDRGVFYVPISAANPLKPGSIEFRQITSEGASSVKPVSMTEAIIFVVAGGKRVSALIGTGQTARPYLARDASKYHSHLFTDITALTVSLGQGTYPERYVYALNSDGKIAVGRFEESREWIGWFPWDGNGTVEWIASEGAETYFTTRYVSGATTARVVERLDSEAQIDMQIDLAAVPSALTPPGGKGPLWFLPSYTVTVLLNGRDFGERATDADGNIEWLDNDDSGAAGWVVGVLFSSTLEPFIRHAEEGQSFRQSMRRRRIGNANISVSHSQGFTWSDGNTTRRVPAYRWGEDLNGAPVVREDSYSFRHLGRAYDPRVVLTKDRPGHLKVLEIALESTV